MNSYRRARFALGVCLALLVMLPPARQAFEQRMLTHMLLQIPALLLAGALVAALLPRLAAPIDRCSHVALPSLFAALLILMFWMLPIAIDHAVASAWWDAAKGVSLVSAGALTATFWPTAPRVVQAFFGGNLAWMGIAAGQLYQDAGPRLCNAYLLDDQSATGMGLTGLAITGSVLLVSRVGAM